MQMAECRLHFAVFSYSHWLLVSRHSRVVARYHSISNRHSCLTPAEMQDRKCFSMQLILVVGKVVMINYICQIMPDVIIVKVVVICQLILLKK